MKYFKLKTSSNQYDDKYTRSLVKTISCKCGCDGFYINFIPAEYTGCYLKLTCRNCGQSEVVFDDYS